MLSGQSPLAISICKTRDGNYTNASGVITAVTGPKADTPSGLVLLVKESRHQERLSYLARFGLCSGILEGVHTLLGGNGIRTGQHLDESVSLILVDNTSLDSTKTSKYAPDLTFSSASTTYE